MQSHPINVTFAAPILNAAPRISGIHPRSRQNLLSSRSLIATDSGDKVVSGFAREAPRRAGNNVPKIVCGRKLFQHKEPTGFLTSREQAASLGVPFNRTEIGCVYVCLNETLTHWPIGASAS
jgi:hypothetical protein